MMEQKQTDAGEPGGQSRSNAGLGLVNEARACARHCDEGAWAPNVLQNEQGVRANASRLLANAADEIERLREQVSNQAAMISNYWRDIERDRAEIERLRAALAKANDQAERFERGWYLRGDALEVAVRQNEHDMLMTGDELRACRAALGA